MFWRFHFTHAEDRSGKGGLVNHPHPATHRLQKEKLRTLTICGWTVTELLSSDLGFHFQEGSSLSLRRGWSWKWDKPEKTPWQLMHPPHPPPTARPLNSTGCWESSVRKTFSDAYTCVYIGFTQLFCVIENWISLHTTAAVRWSHDHMASWKHMLISSHLFVLGEMWHFDSLRSQICTSKLYGLLPDINKLFAIIFCILVDL